MIRCTCGAYATPPREAATVGDIARATGFCAVWDVSAGLTPLWLCPACTATVREHWLAIVTITKQESINLRGFLKWSDVAQE
jgi:hypothetical protein